ncbi:ATP-binding protein [Scytonema sp. NUACC26]|uniref:sensor histidine kinase n=1 Tax=Scytonema sp. NUACC26 TaxID=3140176 RepID=UPI0034DB80D1
MPTFKHHRPIAKNTKLTWRSLLTYSQTKSGRNLLSHLVVGGTALGVSIGAFFSYQVMRELTLLNLQQNALSKVEHGTDEIDSWLATLKARVEMLAYTEQVRSVNWSVARSYLKAEDARIEDFSRFGLTTPDGWRNNTATNQRVNVRDRRWFQKAMSGEIYVDDPIISRSTGFPSIIISAPISKSGSLSSSPIGVVHGAVKVDRVSQAVNRLKYGPGSYAFALTSDGRAIVHPNAALMSTVEKPAPSLLESSEPSLAKVARQMVARKQAIELIQIKAKQFYIAFMPLKNANWSVALVIPRDNIESKLSWLDGIAVAVVSLAGMLIAVLVYVQSVEQSRLKRAKAEAETANQLLELKVTQRTHELKQASDRLEQRVVERTQELLEALEHLAQTQSQLIQTEKMSSLGELVTGIAHEINNPVNFIHGNVFHLNEYVRDLLDVIHLYQQKYPQPDLEIEQTIADFDLEFIKKDLPKILTSMKMGTERIREIVQSLRIFSRMDEAELKAVDLHAGIESTLLILQHRLKARPERPEIEVIKDYGNLPLVECYAGQLNQVFMNILTNAIDAVEEHIRERTYQEIANNPGQIAICTECSSEASASQFCSPSQVKIRIADNGVGMDETVSQKIFHPFFTTKPVGKGRGMGLAISYQIIVDKHKGQLECVSTPGGGTQFLIQIPIKQQDL